MMIEQNKKEYESRSVCYKKKMPFSYIKCQCSEYGGQMAPLASLFSFHYTMSCLQM